MIKTLEIRLFPTPEQEQSMRKHIGCSNCHLIRRLWYGMEKIKYFDKNLFMNGHLSVVVETVEQLENVPEWLQANEITDVFLSVSNKKILHRAILSNEPAPYFRHSNYSKNICTGYTLEVARHAGCTHFCYMKDCLNSQIYCNEFEEFLKDFW